MRTNRVFPLILLLVVVLLTPAMSRTAALSQPTQAVEEETPGKNRTLAEVVDAKVQLESVVREIKSVYDPGERQYSQAREYYTEAQGAYTAWVQVVAHHVKLGKTKKLKGDPEYNRIVKDAREKGKLFLDYAREVEESRAHASGGSAKWMGEEEDKLEARLDKIEKIGKVIDAIGKIGKKIWDYYKRMKQEQRDRAAADFEARAMWKDWKDIR